MSYTTNGRGEAKGLNFFTLALKKTTPAAVVVCWNSVFHSGGDILLKCSGLAARMMLGGGSVPTAQLLWRRYGYSSEA